MALELDRAGTMQKIFRDHALESIATEIEKASSDSGKSSDAVVSKEKLNGVSRFLDFSLHGRRTSVRMSVRTSVGRPSDVRRTSVQTSVRTSVRRAFEDVAKSKNLYL